MENPCWIIIVMVALHGVPTCQESAEEWRNIAKAELDRALNLKQNTKVAKNVILFIGDGMGMSTVTAARVLKAQSSGLGGKQPLLDFEQFPNVGLSKTYSNDRLTASSASTASAIFSGIKLNDGTLGVTPIVKSMDCAASKTKSGRTTSILKWSQDEGKSTGIVTTSRVSHASPAAAYAHSANRYWEGTTEVPAECQDIAAQMFDNLDMQVILGGGRRYILLNNQTDPRTGSVDKRQRTDGRDLIKEWETRNKKATYVYNKGQFDSVDPSSTDYLLGLFAPSHMSFDADRDNSSTGEPSLAEMTRKAIQILKKNDIKGFFLFVEGARIDHGHHNNTAKKALYDTLAMNDAVAAAVDETNEEDTLIVVTADHSHAFNIAGYPTRENDLFGLVDIIDEWGPTDNLPHTTLVYGNGPGPQRTNLTSVDTTDINFQQPNGVPMVEETHTAEDVPIYARGPMAHLFHGVHEQHYIAHVMAYASCVGANKKHCTETKNDPCVSSSSSRNFFKISLIVLSFTNIWNTVF